MPFVKGQYVKGQYVKGQSGNLKGRPPGTKCYVSRELENIAQADGGKKARELAEMLWSQAQGGDIQASRLVLERTEGRAATADELAKRAGVTEAKMAPEQRKQKLLELLRSPEIRSLIEEAVQPATSIVQ